jgi:phytoene dehydrogenase-like protein
LPYGKIRQHLEGGGNSRDRGADKLVTSAEKIMPRLSENILCRHIDIPLTLEKTTLNSQGACWGVVSCKGKQDKEVKEAYKNLYQAGHWTFPGGGVPAAVTLGRNAARLILGVNQV